MSGDLRETLISLDALQAVLQDCSVALTLMQDGTKRDALAVEAILRDMRGEALAAQSRLDEAAESLRDLAATLSARDHTARRAEEDSQEAQQLIGAAQRRVFDSHAKWQNAQARAEAQVNHWRQRERDAREELGAAEGNLNYRQNAYYSAQSQYDACVSSRNFQLQHNQQAFSCSGQHAHLMQTDAALQAARYRLRNAETELRQTQSELSHAVSVLNACYKGLAQIERLIRQGDVLSSEAQGISAQAQRSMALMGEARSAERRAAQSYASGRAAEEAAQQEIGQAAQYGERLIEIAQTVETQLTEHRSHDWQARNELSDAFDLLHQLNTAEAL